MINEFKTKSLKLKKRYVPLKVPTKFSHNKLIRQVFILIGKLGVSITSSVGIQKGKA